MTDQPAEHAALKTWERRILGSLLGVSIVLALLSFIGTMVCWFMAVWTVDHHQSLRWANAGGLLLIPMFVGGFGSIVFGVMLFDE